MENLGKTKSFDTVPTDKEEISSTISKSPLASALYTHFKKYRPELIERIKDSGDQISEGIS